MRRRRRWHLLTHGDTTQLQLVADDRIDRRAKFGRFIQFGQNTLLHTIGLERGDYVVKCVAMTSCIQNQQAVDPWDIQYLKHIALARIAGRNAGGVDEHHLLVFQ